MALEPLSRTMEIFASNYYSNSLLWSEANEIAFVTCRKIHIIRPDIGTHQKILPNNRKSVINYEHDMSRSDKCFKSRIPDKAFKSNYGFKAIAFSPLLMPFDPSTLLAALTLSGDIFIYSSYFVGAGLFENWQLEFKIKDACKNKLIDFYPSSELFISSLTWSEKWVDHKSLFVFGFAHGSICILTFNITAPSNPCKKYEIHTKLLDDRIKLDENRINEVSISPFTHQLDHLSAFIVAYDAKRNIYIIHLKMSNKEENSFSYYIMHQYQTEDYNPTCIIQWGRPVQTMDDHIPLIIGKGTRIYYFEPSPSNTDHGNSHTILAENLELLHDSLISGIVFLYHHLNRIVVYLEDGRSFIYLLKDHQLHIMNAELSDNVQNTSSESETTTDTELEFEEEIIDQKSKNEYVHFGLTRSPSGVFKAFLRGQRFESFASLTRFASIVISPNVLSSFEFKKILLEECQKKENTSPNNALFDWEANILESIKDDL